MLPYLCIITFQAAGCLKGYKSFPVSAVDVTTRKMKISTVLEKQANKTYSQP